MNSKKNIVKAVKGMFENISPLKNIVEAIRSEGGTAFIVGGSVRDAILQRLIKDIDIEVHGISFEHLENILKQFGPIYDAGKSFGVVRISGINIDWSIPRKDSKGRKPKVYFDSSMTFEDAARRRDVTMNALGIDLNVYLEGREENMLIDPRGGIRDIENKILRAVDCELFNDDPLRFYRVMHFISRFEMTPDEELNDICKKSYLGALARERIFEEFKKMLLLSRRPSLGLRWIRSIGRLAECFPEVAMLIDVVQNPEYHPEGDVFEHTMQALDASALLEYRNEDEKLMIMVATLCHDFGKAVCTTPDGKSYGHAQAGVPLASAFISRLTSEHALRAAVEKLVEYHLMPGQLVDQNSSPRAYKRLALKLAPNISLYQLSFLARCDMRGRNGVSHEPLTDEGSAIQKFLERAQRAYVMHEKEKPILLGRDFLTMVSNNREIGALVNRAYELQIDEHIVERDVLLQRVMGEYKKSKK